MSSVKRSLPVAAVIIAALSLAACGGGGGASKESEAEGPRGVFTSTTDCMESKLFDAKTCGEAISEAINDHRKNAPTYDNERVCRAKEQHCERAYTNQYRPRLLAFLLHSKKIDEKTKVVAEPLYPPNSTEKGLRDAAGKKYLTTDFTIVYSAMSKRALASNPYTDPKKMKF